MAQQNRNVEELSRPVSGEAEIGSSKITKVITIEVQGGVVVDVRGLPEGYTYTLEDHDVEETTA